MLLPLLALLLSMANPLALNLGVDLDNESQLYLRLETLGKGKLLPVNYRRGGGNYG